MSNKIELTLQQAKDELVITIEDESFTFDEFMANLIRSGYDENFKEGYKVGLERGYFNGYAEGMRDRDKDH